jgi:hypothetical protein
MKEQIGPQPGPLSFKSGRSALIAHITEIGAFSEANRIRSGKQRVAILP